MLCQDAAYFINKLQYIFLKNTFKYPKVNLPSVLLFAKFLHLFPYKVNVYSICALALNINIFQNFKLKHKSS